MARNQADLEAGALAAGVTTEALTVRGPQTTTGGLAPLKPFVLRAADAGRAIGRSDSWLRKRRFEDLKRVERGLPPKGPRWSVLDGIVCYQPDELAEWVAGNLEPLGRATSDAFGMRNSIEVKPITPDASTGEQP